MLKDFQWILIISTSRCGVCVIPGGSRQVSFLFDIQQRGFSKVSGVTGSIFHDSFQGSAYWRINCEKERWQNNPTCFLYKSGLSFFFSFFLHAILTTIANIWRRCSVVVVQKRYK